MHVVHNFSWCTLISDFLSIFVAFLLELTHFCNYLKYANEKLFVQSVDTAKVEGQRVAECKEWRERSAGSTLQQLPVYHLHLKATLLRYHNLF